MFLVSRGGIVETRTTRNVPHASQHRKAENVASRLYVQASDKRRGLLALQLFFLIMQWRILSPTRAVWINFSNLNSIRKLFQFSSSEIFFHDTKIVFLCALISFFGRWFAMLACLTTASGKIILEQSVLREKIACERRALSCLPTIFELVSERTSKEIFFFHASRVPWW